MFTVSCKIEFLCEVWPGVLTASAHVIGTPYVYGLSK